MGRVLGYVPLAISTSFRFAFECGAPGRMPGPRGAGILPAVSEVCGAGILPAVSEVCGAGILPAASNSHVSQSLPHRLISHPEFPIR